MEQCIRLSQAFNGGGSASAERNIGHRCNGNTDQMAVALAHCVFAAAGSDEKCRACEALGAVHAINYRDEDFVEVIKEEAGGKGEA